MTELIETIISTLPRRNSKFEQEVQKQKESLQDQKIEILHEIFPDTKLLHEKTFFTGYLAITVLELISFLYALKALLFIWIYIILLFPIVFVVTSLILYFSLYIERYTDENICWLITRRRIYCISQAWSPFQEWSDIKNRSFEMRNIYQAEYEYPGWYRFFNISDIGVIKMKIHHDEYINEVRLKEQAGKSTSSRISTVHGKLVAPLEIYGLKRPHKVVDDINYYSDKMRQDPNWQ